MMETNDLKSKAVKSVAWSFAGNMANKVIQFVISLILARMLTPADYGLLGMLGFFMGIASTFIDSGFSSALVQYKDRRNIDYCTVFYVNFGMSVLMYGLLYITAPLIADFYNQPILINIIRIYCLTLIIGSLAAINNIRLNIDLNFKVSNIISTSGAFLSGIVGITCAYYGLGVWALIIQQLFFGVYRVCTLLFFVRWFPSLEFSIKSFKRFFSYGSKLLVANLIHSAYSQMYPLVIGKEFTPSELGYVTRAQGFNDVAAGTINGILSNVAFPVLTRVQDDNQELLRLYDRYIQLSAFIVMPIVLLMCGIAKPFILLCLTDKWAESIPLLQILSLGYIWNGISGINQQLLYVKGRTDLVLKLEIIKKCIAFAILIVSIIIGNLMFFCTGLTLYSIIALYLNTIYTDRILNFSLKLQLKQIWPYLINSTTILAISLLFSSLVPNYIISLALSIFICIPLYLWLSYHQRLYALIQVVHITYRRLGKVGLWLKAKVDC